MMAEASCNGGRAIRIEGFGADAFFQTVAHVNLHLNRPHHMVSNLTGVSCDETGITIETDQTALLIPLANCLAVISHEQLLLLLSDTMSALRSLHVMGLHHGCMDETAIMISPDFSRALLLDPSLEPSEEEAAKLRKRDIQDCARMLLRVAMHTKILVTSALVHLMDEDLCNAAVALRTEALKELISSNKSAFEGWQTSMSDSLLSATHVDCAARADNIIADVTAGVVHCLLLSKRTGDMHLPIFHDHGHPARGIGASASVIQQFFDSVVITTRILRVTEWGLWPNEDSKSSHDNQRAQLACFGYILGYCLALRISVSISLPRMLFYYVFAPMSSKVADMSSLQGSGELVNNTKSGILAMRKGAQWFTRLPMFVTWSVNRLYDSHFNSAALCTLATLPLSAFQFKGAEFTPHARLVFVNWIRSLSHQVALALTRAVTSLSLVLPQPASVTIQTTSLCDCEPMLQMLTCARVLQIPSQWLVSRDVLHENMMMELENASIADFNSL